MPLPTSNASVCPLLSSWHNRVQACAEAMASIKDKAERHAEKEERDRPAARPIAIVVTNEEDVNIEVTTEGRGWRVVRR